MPSPTYGRSRSRSQDRIPISDEQVFHHSTCARLTQVDSHITRRSPNKNKADKAAAAPAANNATAVAACAGVGAGAAAANGTEVVVDANADKAAAKVC